jgi:signal transduction histidine kinase/CheY-like chemotaxis protein/Tfp pilus assembly protein PilF
MLYFSCDTNLYMLKVTCALILSAIIWLSAPSVAQINSYYSLSSNQIDSLLSSSQKLSPEEMIAIGNAILSSSIDKTAHQKAQAYEVVGLGLYKQNFYISAIKELENAIENFLVVNDNAKVASLYNRIGVSYTRLGQYGKSMENLKIALKYREEIGDTTSIASTLNNIAICLRETKQEDAALKTYLKSFKLFQATNHIKGQASSLNNIGIILFDQHQYDSALVYFNRALELKNNLSDTVSLANTIGNIGRVYSSMQQYKKAYENYNLAISLYEKKDDIYGLAYAYSNLAQTYLNQDMPLKAYPLIIKSQELTSSDKSSALALTILKLLSDYYMAIGKYKESRDLLAEYTQISKENFSEQISSHVAELSFIFDSELNEQERKILEVELELGKVKLQKNQYTQIALFSLSFLLLAMLIVSTSFLRRYRQKNRENARINADLNHINNHLELIVDNRTRDLLSTLKRAQQSDLLKSAFLANMSHEIRTPLNGILGFTRLLSDNTLPEQTRKEYLNIIDKRGKSLLQIINDIINISLIDSGQVEVKNITFNLNKLLLEIYSIFNSENFDKKKDNVEIKLQLSLSDSRCNIIADPLRIEQILVNLIDNALKYTNNGVVEFGYQIGEKNQIVFFVKDTGVGIPDSKRDKVFNRFNREIEGFARNTSGTGLGLPICKGLVTLLKGNIWFDSKEFEGSAFYFSIPYNSADSEVDSHTSRSFATAQNLDFSKKVILVVEDDLISYQFIEALLTDTEAKLIHAKNGEDAIEICKIADLDLVIMDMRLPFTTGYEATAKIKTLKPNLTVIAQTANVMSEDKAKCFEVGCDAFIPKPIDPDEFIRLVAHYINNPVLI